MSPTVGGPEPTAPKPPTYIKVDVKNPRYKDATIVMVAKALLQRPPERREGQWRGARDRLAFS